MVWLSVILTELELEEDQLLEPICNDCNLCVDICPVHAIDNVEINQSACWDYAFGEVKKDWRISCHKCRDICPYNFGVKNKELKRLI
ncbi:4Fe-4S double cluster binding domain-containing protein [Anaerocolumna sp. MB42-C2]|uniref:4Fe-4S double cluster binding domain-containing protein n=1 Tax=Anaerocolumna sp. MB42-C2 TaxID=3070997 RepID=UPI0027DEB643|nr:4Fe-4S double cluster binding domain-containing protein [Anaerocolumna sp. MB42-C2]WMJ90333.1 4Fe-4S binding protein [Anaerocolumna sp. MB42-C2]